jgi:hypothetical protein
MHSRADWVALFERLGLADADQWADCVIDENLGNLPRAAFLHQAWKEIPGSNDTAWLADWMTHARVQGEEPSVVSAYDQLLASGADLHDLIPILRALMAGFLFRVSYLLDDPSLDDPALAEAARWGLYEESEQMQPQPLRRLGCIHELVRSIDPERQRNP